MKTLANTKSMLFYFYLENGNEISWGVPQKREDRNRKKKEVNYKKEKIRVNIIPF